MKRKEPEESNQDLLRRHARIYGLPDPGPSGLPGILVAERRTYPIASNEPFFKFKNEEYRVKHHIDRPEVLVEETPTWSSSWDQLYSNQFVSYASMNKESELVQPEVELRRAIRRANSAGVPLAKIVEIFDLENVRLIHDS